MLLAVFRGSIVFGYFGGGYLDVGICGDEGGNVLVGLPWERSFSISSLIMPTKAWTGNISGPRPAAARRAFCARIACSREYVFTDTRTRLFGDARLY